MGKEQIDESTTNEIVGSCKLCKGPVFKDEAWVLDGTLVEHQNCRDVVDERDS